ncbi:MAG: bifunctional UDP-N-acetylglucosamine diphosphorylase/glucosamine-1-phosphate N-acetyltransferase GlmU [Bryobacteraceae bacterium]|nr:bifunctional UDP-N-acetylglucosamine diphosphorylase/glucosamine-1-phosphate N-acetyltransferase GlmU [Bryobacterales bacterium]MEB2361721.1 bifunctional UDP-N-acetylglucosamine diphosphorylase/glucosamine-1-phosphate N-acetyltransferase GlmU [Bryobacterales bacterium]NUN03474.1 bifunctional UDP-N-acetylglucosamine diphosphorylase/glucosamine-1-phosphate N-acetyltransferase GlmU [Bryobacteraceae bacterium]
MLTNLRVIVLAAGLGTRMKSKRAKVLHRAGGRTLIDHVVGTALELTTPEQVAVVVGHQREDVEELMAPRRVRFVHQREQKGTGHAVMVCRDALESHTGLLLVLYGDCPLLSVETLRALIERQRQSSAAATVITTTLEDPTGYGRVLLDAGGSVQAIVEQKAATPEELQVRIINSGIYCFRSDLLWESISSIQPDNPAREYYLTDIVKIFHASGHKVNAMHLDDANEVLGINTRIELAGVDRIFRERKVRQLMLDGVTIEKPETVTVDLDATVGPDTVIEAFARILGSTQIGEDCTVGAHSIVRDSQIADGVTIHPFSVVELSTISSGAHIGPYSRLRVGSYVEAGAHIGNFVELKKTRIGPGSKANHLAYLGDSEIGPGVNIGAGTITCNYDGVHKHPTRIGAGAFVGSNSTLVAPLEIGANSYIGAGSVITEKVPEDSLALGRGRQIVKADWVSKRRSEREVER